MLQLKFNHSLSKEGRNLQQKCNSIVHAVATEVQNHVMKAFNIKIDLLKQELRNISEKIAKRINNKQLKQLFVKLRKLLIKKRENKNKNVITNLKERM